MEKISFSDKLYYSTMLFAMSYFLGHLIYALSK